MEQIREKLKFRKSSNRSLLMKNNKLQLENRQESSDNSSLMSEDEK